MTENAVYDLKSASLFANPVVYALCDEDGSIFYVGKSVNLKKRIATHRQCQTPNPLMKKRCRNKFWFRILHDNPSDLRAAEIYEIQARSGSLLNMVYDDNEGWNKASKPWMAGSRLQSPSHRFLRRIHNEDVREEIKDAIKKMSDPQRCHYELGLLDALRSSGHTICDAWADKAIPKMADYARSLNAA